MEKCKEDISNYIEDKSSIIKDYGINLEVEKKAAAELMRRIQKLTREELKEKVQILSQVDDRIRGYDASLTELIGMTGRVQENMNRIREESAFVEGVVKRLGEIREKVEGAEDEISSISQELDAIGLRFEKDNTDMLEKAAEMVVSETRSAIHGLDARLSREEERITEIFATAVEKAGGRAEKVEEAALAKLRGQAEERLGRIKTGFEDNLKSLQELVKTNRDEIQELIKCDKEEWTTEIAAINAQKEAYSAAAKQSKDEWNRQAEELRGELDKHRDEWKELCDNTGLDITAAAEERLGRIKTGFEDNLKSLQELVKTNQDEIQELIKRDKEEWTTEIAAINAQKEAYSAAAKQSKDEWNRQAEELRGELDKHRDEWKELCDNTGLDITTAVEERLGRIKTGFEDKLKSVQDFVETNQDEMQERIERDKEEWKTETDEMDGRKKTYLEDVKRYREEWESQAEELAAFMKRQVAETTASIIEQDEDLRGEIAKHREEWKTLYNDTGLDIAAAVEERLDGYRLAQEERLNQLANITDNSDRLEEELRLALEGAATRVKGEFARVEHEMCDAWESTSSEYKNNLQALRGELSEIEVGLSKIREMAYESMSGKLKTFEDEFLADISKRGAETSEQLDAWQEAFNSKLEAITTDAETRRRKAEIKITDEMKKDFADLSENLMSNLESLKTHAASFEERATREMREANEERRLLSEQLEQSLTEAKKTMEEVRQESTAMSKAFERSGALKKELDLHDDKLSDTTERLSQLNTDVTKFESQFAQMKHLEDDINARITRFTAEKRRIEGIESDFNNLLRTAKSVEEKLAQVSNSDDTLQAVQVKIRQLDDAMKDAEEKFQRVERKTQTMQETNEGIDRNFRILQESEQLINRLDGTVGVIKTDMEAIRRSVEVLSAENERTLEAAEKLSTLDDSIKWLEDRIDEMNKAREMVTRLATELRELDDSARSQLKMTRSLLKQPGGRPGKASDDGAPPPRDRDNIIRLRRQGWDIDEIARSMGIAKGEVELILELAPKDL